MVKRADGFWQTTISIPNDASQINFVFNNGSGSWDNSNGQNWNVNISGSCAAGTVASDPCTPVRGNAVQLFYNGSLVS
jgi:alpha-amylase